MVIKRRELYEESDDTVYFFAIQTIIDSMINIKKFLRGIEFIFEYLYHANMYSREGKNCNYPYHDTFIAKAEYF